MQTAQHNAAAFILTRLVPMGQLIAALQRMRNPGPLKKYNATMWRLWDPLQRAFLEASKRFGREPVEDLWAWTTSHEEVLVSHLEQALRADTRFAFKFELAAFGSLALEARANTILESLPRAPTYDQSLKRLDDLLGYSDARRHQWLTSAAQQVSKELRRFNLRSLVHNANPCDMLQLYASSTSARKRAQREDQVNRMASPEGQENLRRLQDLAVGASDEPTPDLLESGAGVKLTRVPPGITVKVTRTGSIELEAEMEPRSWLTKGQLKNLMELNMVGTNSRLRAALEPAARTFFCAPAEFYETLVQQDKWLREQRKERFPLLEEALSEAHLRAVRQRLTKTVLNTLSPEERAQLLSLLQEAASGSA